MPDIAFRFPVAGVDTQRAVADQRPRQVDKENNVWGRTTPLAVNVRGYEATQQRRRGGTRPGLRKYVEARPGGDFLIQELAATVTTDGVPVQTSLSGRVVSLVALNQGTVYRVRAGDDAWTIPTNNSGRSPAFNYDGIMFSAPNVQKLWIADGTQYGYYDPIEDTVENWTATAGDMPADEDNNYCRLIETWRGRTVMSGLILEPQNIFFSAVNDPQDWDYNPTDITPTQAVALNLAPQGQVGDVVTGMIPASDDVLLIGTDNGIHRLAGDPMANGNIDKITNAIGMAYGRAWCMDPYGAVLFLSNRMSIYSLSPGGGPPVRISQPIDNLLADLNSGSLVFRLGWDDRYQGVHVFMTSGDGPTEGDEHWFYEARSGAWFKQKFKNPDHNPCTCTAFDGNTAGDRVFLIGSWDGYVRGFHPDAESDDGWNIESEVVIGPLVDQTLNEFLLHAVQAVLGEDSGDVNYSVYVGDTAERALSSDPVLTGTFRAGRNFSEPVRRSGHGIYVKLSGTTRWALEQLRCHVSTRGPVRMRGA